MLKNVDEGVALLRLVEGRPIRHALHPVAVKDFYGVITEARLELGQSFRSGMIDAEFVNDPGGLRGIGLVLPGSCPKGCGEQCGRRKRLNESSSFHGRILAEDVEYFCL